MNLREWLDKQTDKAERLRLDLLEQLAAAFMLKTDLPPDECVLCVEYTAHGVRHWFERKAT